MEQNRAGQAAPNDLLDLGVQDFSGRKVHHHQLHPELLQSVVLIIWALQSVLPSMPNVIIHYVIRVAI